MDTKEINLSDPASVAAAVKKNKNQPIKMQVYFLHGIFGELPNCNGIAEEVLDTDEKLEKYGIDPKEGGTYMKIIGCSYLYKGDPKMARVFGMEQAKSMISEIPREILGRSKAFILALLFLLLFRRRNLIHYANVYLDSIKKHTMRLYMPKWARLKRSVREIRRAMDAALKQEFKIDPEYDLYERTAPTSVKGTDIELAGLITKITAFFGQIMEFDGAYCFPTQDMFGEVDKENARRSGAKEMLRLVDLMIERNTNLTIVPGISERRQGVPYKFRFMKKVLRLIFWLSPRARRITQKFLLELDAEKVGLDDADWFFCLRRNTHNYRGVPLPERLKELERIDKERHHTYVKIDYKKTEPIPNQ